MRIALDRLCVPRIAVFLTCTLLVVLCAGWFVKVFSRVQSVVAGTEEYFVHDMRARAGLLSHKARTTPDSPPKMNAVAYRRTITDEGGAIALPPSDQFVQSESYLLSRRPSNSLISQTESSYGVVNGRERQQRGLAALIRQRQASIGVGIKSAAIVPPGITTSSRPSLMSGTTSRPAAASLRTAQPKTTAAATPTTKTQTDQTPSIRPRFVFRQIDNQQVEVWELQTDGTEALQATQVLDADEHFVVFEGKTGGNAWQRIFEELHALLQNLDGSGRLESDGMRIITLAENNFLHVIGLKPNDTIALMESIPFGRADTSLLLDAVARDTVELVIVRDLSVLTITLFRFDDDI